MGLEGDWETFLDPSTNRNFFWNHATNVAQWERPADLLRAEQQKKKHVSFKGDGDWQKMTDDEGRTYYYSKTTGESKWTPPETTSSLLESATTTEDFARLRTRSVAVSSAGSSAAGRPMEEVAC